MEKFIIFGAGSFGARFYEELSAERKKGVLFFVDNDEKKIGTTLHGVEIRPAESLTALCYDKLYIASMFTEEITTQLLSMGIDQEKIVYCPKNIPKKDKALPFADENRRKLANELLCHITSYFDARGSKLFAAYGTALGIYRDNTILPWDHDIDLVLLEPVEKEVIFDLVDDLSLTFSAFNPWSSAIARDVNDSSRWRGYKLLNSMFNIDINQGRYTKKRTPGLITTQLFRELSLQESKNFPFASGYLYLPELIEQYLEYIYGADWRTRKKDFSYYDQSYAYSSANGIFKEEMISR